MKLEQGEPTMTQTLDLNIFNRHLSPEESLSQNVDLLQELHISDSTANDIHADWTYIHPNFGDTMSSTHDNVATYRIDSVAGDAFNELPFSSSANLECYDYRLSNQVDPMQFCDPEIFNHSGEQSYTCYPLPPPPPRDHRRVRTQRNLRR